MYTARYLPSVVLALTFSAGAMAAPPPVIEIQTSQADQSSSGVGRSTAARNNAELLMIIDQLQDEVRSLRGELEQQAFRLKKMERQQLDRYRDLDRRISSLMSREAPAATTNKASNPKSSDVTESAQSQQPDRTVQSSSVPQTSDQSDSSKPQVKPASVSVKNGVSDSKAYREAFGLVRARDFPAAVVAFSAFVRDYPNSARVANAYYWMGEIHHAEQKLEKAREAFALVLGQYPEHPKAPHAAFKLGVIYSELGDQVRSEEYLDYVLKNHPKSNVAPLVEEFKRK
ncbi:tol-pal system protein YbgF [Pontibacterium sp.]|uniref:tol-pal system protein YbgF n=1 Tax=Pontibacterium sp. TaxID=2036026 RepID=UPI003561CD2B